MQIDWWLQPRVVFGHSFSGIIWHMPQKWSQFNCMTLSWWPRHEIVSVTLHYITLFIYIYTCCPYFAQNTGNQKYFLFLYCFFRLVFSNFYHSFNIVFLSVFCVFRYFVSFGIVRLSLFHVFRYFLQLSLCSVFCYFCSVFFLFPFCLFCIVSYVQFRRQSACLLTLLSISFLYPVSASSELYLSSLDQISLFQLISLLPSGNFDYQPCVHWFFWFFLQ